MKSEIKGLTGVRFLAALWVMCFHFFTGVKSGFIARLIHFGFTGVVLFFVLSGFVLMYVYGGAALDDAAQRRNF